MMPTKTKRREPRDLDFAADVVHLEAEVNIEQNSVFCERPCPQLEHSEE